VAVLEEPLATPEKRSVGVRVLGSENLRFGRKPVGKRKCRVDDRETSSAAKPEQQP
jgi:hypothetical protein